MQPVHTQIETGLFPGFLYDNFHFFLRFLDDFLNTGGVDTTINDKFLQSHPANFPTYWIISR